MTTFSTPPDFAAIAALIKSDLSQIGINVNIVTQDPATFAANNGVGTFDWDLTARGMRGDVDGYVAEYNPTRRRVYQTWFNGLTAGTTKRSGASIGNGRITLDPKKRLPMYQQLDQAPDGRAARDPARLGVEVPGREHAAEEHVRRVHRLQHRPPDGYIKSTLERRPAGGAGDAGPAAIFSLAVQALHRSSESPR